MVSGATLAPAALGEEAGASGAAETLDRVVVTATRLYRNSSRNLCLVVEPVASKGPIFTYDPITDTYPSGDYIGGFLQTNLGAVSRDSAYLAFEYAGAVSIMDISLNTLDVLSGVNGGLIFGAAQNVLFAVDESADQIVAVGNGVRLEPSGGSPPTGRRPA